MVAVANEVFDALLGTSTPLAGVPFDVPYFLGVTVAGDPEMTPRQPLAASPYAIRAGTADKGGSSADASLVLWQGTVLTNGGASNARDYVAEMPPLSGEVDVVSGAAYGLWVSVGSIAGNPNAVCYLARNSTVPDNVMFRYTPIKALF